MFSFFDKVECNDETEANKAFKEVSNFTFLSFLIPGMFLSRGGMISFIGKCKYIGYDGKYENL